MDIGGSLTKVVVAVPHGPLSAPRSEFLMRCIERMPRHPGHAASLAFSDASGTYSFVKFETKWMPDLLAILDELGARQEVSSVHCTGGGAYKYAPAFAEQLGIALQPVDEMAALAEGFEHFASLPPAAGEVYEYNLDAPPRSDAECVPWTPRKEGPSLPALLVSIGSGVSLLRVSEAEEDGMPVLAERVSGSSIGGATFWGLCRLLTPYQSFDEAVAAADEGDNEKVAMLVRDIYGGEYARLGLPGAIVASDFGKIAVRTHPLLPDPLRAEPPISHPDLVRGLIVLVLNNIAQVAFLTAQREGLDRVYFTGSFLRQGTMMRTLTSALRFWSRGSVRALFLRHEAFFGAFGALRHSALVARTVA